MSQRGKRKLTLWQRFISNDLLIALSISIPLSIWIELLNGKSWIDLLLASNRSIIYSTLTTLNGTILGFIIATATIVIGYIRHPQLFYARESAKFPDIGQFFKNCIRYLGLSTVMSLIGLIGDRDKMPINLIFCLVTFSFILAISSVVRALILFEQILLNVFQPEKKQPLPTRFSSVSPDNPSS